MQVKLTPESWPDSFLFFRKKRKRSSDVSLDGPIAEGISVTTVTTRLTASSTPPEADEALPASDRKLDLTVVNTALVAVNQGPAAMAMEPANPAISLKATLAARRQARNVALLSPSTSMPSLDQVIARIREIFDDYRLLTPPPPGLPDPMLSFASVTERSVGIGSRIGNEPLGAFGMSALKGIRLEVVLRFQLWANSMGDTDTAVQNLIARLLANRDALREKGVLRLSLKNLGESASNDPNAWWQTADFTVLYEEPFVDNDGAESLIAQIPVKINSDFNETMTLTDAMMRWDDKDAAPPLVVRGPLQIAVLSALYFHPGPEPTGTVTLRRTFDGVVGLPSAPADFDAFLAAITDPVNPDRNAELVFNSLTDFLAQFSATGDPVELGEAAALAQYELQALEINPPITLPLVTDRFEIVYEHQQFNQPAVLYLRAAHSITT